MSNFILEDKKFPDTTIIMTEKNFAPGTEQTSINSTSYDILKLLQIYHLIYFSI